MSDSPMSELHRTEEAWTTSLASIDAFWVALTSTAISASIGGESRASDTVSALDRRISLAHEVMMALNGWCRIVVEDRPVSHGIPLGTDVPAMLAFLTLHAQWFSGHEAAPDALEEMQDWAVKVRLAAFPVAREWMAIGDCPLMIDDGQGTEAVCGGTIRVYADPARDPDCTTCRTVAVIEWWRPLMESSLSPIVTTQELVALVHREFGKPVTSRSVRYWVSKGWITPRTQVQGEATTYDTEATLLALAHHWRRQSGAA